VKGVDESMPVNIAVLDSSFEIVASLKVLRELRVK
jgi:hypothetical protein